MVKKIIYISHTRLDYSLNSVCIKGLKENGVEIAGFHVKNRGLYGLIKAASFYMRNSNNTDLVMVGYDSPVLVSLFRLFCRKRVVYNAVLSAHERLVVSRGLTSRFSV